MPRTLWQALRRFAAWVEPALIAEWIRLMRGYAASQSRTLDEGALAAAPRRHAASGRAQAARGAGPACAGTVHLGAGRDARRAEGGRRRRHRSDRLNSVPYVGQNASRATRNKVGNATPTFNRNSMVDKAHRRGSGNPAYSQAIEGDAPPCAPGYEFNYSPTPEKHTRPEADKR